MVSICATEDEAHDVIHTLNTTATTVVAAVNSKDSVVVSGPTKDVLAVKDAFAARGKPTTRLRVSHAFHSPMMQSVLDLLRTAIQNFSTEADGKPTIPLASTVTGKLVAANDLTADYWLDHVVAPVRFADAVHTLSTAAGSSTMAFVEVGPSSPLANYVPGAISSSGSKGDEVEILLSALGKLWVRGIQPRVLDGGGGGWDAVFAGSGARKVALPVYPFQRRRYWLEAPKSTPLSTPAKKDPGSPILLPLRKAAPVDGVLIDGSDTDNNKLEHPITPPNEADESSSSPTSTGTPTSSVSSALPSPSPWQIKLHALAPKDRRMALLALVQDEVAGVLGFATRQDVVASAWDTPLTELGFDSVLGILLRNRVGKLAGVALPGNLIFREEMGTAVALVGFLLGRMGL